MKILENHSTGKQKNIYFTTYLPNDNLTLSLAFKNGSKLNYDNHEQYPKRYRYYFQTL